MSVDLNPRARSADTEYLVRRSMTKGYQLFSVLTPPIYTAIVLLRRGRGHFTVNRMLRATWLGGAVGLAAGGGFDYVRSSLSNPETLKERRLKAAYDTTSLRADDHATIGGLLFSILTPAMFWKRATAIHLILGGAGLGTGAGLSAHYLRELTGDAAPKSPVPEATH